MDASDLSLHELLYVKYFCEIFIGGQIYIFHCNEVGRQPLPFIVFIELWNGQWGYVNEYLCRRSYIFFVMSIMYK